ncbi:MAG: hypothetical protein AAB071_05370 [Bacteroidota bacterium]
MTLQEARTKFPNEWMAFKELEEGDNPNGEIIYHHKERRRFHQAILEKKIINVYITYNGLAVPEDMAIMF